MSAVRLDPFRRLVNVGWPSAAAGPFRMFHQAARQTLTIYRYTFALQIHDNQTGVYFTTDRLRLVVGGVPLDHPAAPTVTYIAALTQTSIGGIVTPTPAGYTVILASGFDLTTLYDTPSDEIAIVRGGVPVLSVPVTSWPAFAFAGGGWPAVSGVRTHERVK